MDIWVKLAIIPPRFNGTAFAALCCAVQLAVLSSFATNPCRAQVSGSQPDPLHQLKQLSLEQLMNIEVTSVAKKEQKVGETAAAIFVITQEEIRRSGVTSIPEALRLAPGVTVSRIDGNSWAIGVRGFGSGLSRSVLVLIDGRSVYTPLFAGVYWDVQDTLLEDIDRIEVIRGPGASLWGANAVNGVVNITTKKAKDTQGLLITLAPEMRNAVLVRFAMVDKSVKMLFTASMPSTSSGTIPCCRTALAPMT